MSPKTALPEDLPLPGADAGIVRLRSPFGDVLVDVKRTSTVRDVRAALLGLAYALVADDRLGDSSGTQKRHSLALLVLVGTRIRAHALKEELQQLRFLISTELGTRIETLVAGEDGRVDRRFLPHEVASDLQRLITQCAAQGGSSALRGPRMGRGLVKAMLLESHLTAGIALPATVLDLQRLCGASYPTARAALTELADLGALDVATTCRLHRPGPPVWHAIATDLIGERRTKRFVDPTRQSRPEAMLGWLERMNERRAGSSVDFTTSCAVSGVLGAKQHFSGLDISVAMRLDLCVFDGDDEFVRELDATLVASDDPAQKPVLVLHFTRDIRATVNRGPVDRPEDTANVKMPSSLAPPGGQTVRAARRVMAAASAIDCYADLLLMGYAGEAREFAQAMTARAGRWS